MRECSAVASEGSLRIELVEEVERENDAIEERFCSRDWGAGPRSGAASSLGLDRAAWDGLLFSTGSLDDGARGMPDGFVGAAET